MAESRHGSCTHHKHRAARVAALVICLAGGAVGAVLIVKYCGRLRLDGMISERDLPRRAALFHDYDQSPWIKAGYYEVPQEWRRQGIGWCALYDGTRQTCIIFVGEVSVDALVSKGLFRADSASWTLSGHEISFHVDRSPVVGIVEVETGKLDMVWPTPERVQTLQRALWSGVRARTPRELREMIEAVR